jgi:hypothetical protein
MMITYVGLDLGVGTSVVTNSASNVNAADGAGHSMEATEAILDIRRSSNDSETV